MAILRRLLVVGATSVTRRAPGTDTRTGAWVRSLLERKPTRLVTVAIANKTARIVWALLAKEEIYKAATAIWTMETKEIQAVHQYRRDEMQGQT